MIKLNKPVFRVTYEAVKDRSKRRALVAGLMPGDLISVRMQGTRQVVIVPVVDVWWYANRKKAAATARERTLARRAKRAANKLELMNGGKS
jgi:hypothetical protein